MVQKLILSILLCLASSLPALAQLENVDDTTRLGGKNVYQKNYHYYVVFMKFIDRFKVEAKDADGNIRHDANGNVLYNTNDFKLVPDEWPCDSMYECWRRLYDGAPFYTVNTYLYGATMLDSMARHAPKSDAERLMYFQDLMQVYKDRIRRCDSLNSTLKKEKARSKRSAVMTKAADVYYQTAPLIKGSGYTPEKAYNNYVKAFEAVRNESDAGSDEIYPIYLANYFDVCRKVYDTDSTHSVFLEQFLTDYTTCLATCNKMMSAYKDKDETKWNGYANVYNYTKYIFRKSGAGSVSNLERFYSPRVDSLKEDYEGLKSIINFMLTSNDSLITSNLFYKACRLSYKLKHDYLNCIGLATAAKNQLEDREEALKYFTEAETLSTTPQEHYLSSRFVAESLASEQEPKETMGEIEWSKYNGLEKRKFNQLYRKRQFVAAKKFREAINYGLEAGMDGQDLAPTYMNMARAYRKAYEPASFDLAYDALDELLRVYPAYDKKLIESEQANIARWIGYQAREQAQWDDYERRVAKSASAKAAWDKQKEEERKEAEFWGGKK